MLQFGIPKVSSVNVCNCRNRQLMQNSSKCDQNVYIICLPSLYLYITQFRTLRSNSNFLYQHYAKITISFEYITLLCEAIRILQASENRRRLS